MRPLRISFVIDNLSRAGTESQLLALIRHLDRSRVEPSLVLLDGDNELSRSLEPADREILRLGVTKLAGRTSAAAAVTLRRHWKQYRPDVVQIYFLDPAYFAVPVAKLAGVRRVVRVRNNLGYWLSAKHRVLNRALRPWVDATLTNTSKGAELLSPSDRPHVIENGVDLNRFADFPPPNLSRSLVNIGCVANLRPVKNTDGLLRAAKIVCDRFPHARFAVAGEGECRPTLVQLRRELGLDDRFDLSGSLADIPQFLKSCELFVLPSHSEGMSNALLEAMAAGRAIVATAVGGTPNLLGGAGVLVSPDAIADGICRVLADADYARKLGAAAKRRAEQFGRAAMIERFIAFWQSLTQLPAAVAGPQGVHRVAAPEVRGDLLQVP